jgi:hypothetical protein
LSKNRFFEFSLGGHATTGATAVASPSRQLWRDKKKVWDGEDVCFLDKESPWNLNSIYGQQLGAIPPWQRNSEDRRKDKAERQ